MHNDYQVTVVSESDNAQTGISAEEQMLKYMQNLFQNKEAILSSAK